MNISIFFSIKDCFPQNETQKPTLSHSENPSPKSLLFPTKSSMDSQ